MHWIYLIHKFHNLSWITEIYELFHNILIYWDAPVNKSTVSKVYLQEGTTAPTLSPPAEKSKPPSTHPHHLLQGYHWERADQLHHCLVRKLLCSRPQDPPADSEHRCKNHWCPSPLHPGHFPYTMLQQSKKYRGGPHPPLPQSLPAPTLR